MPIINFSLFKHQKNCPVEYVGTELSLKRGRVSIRADVFGVSNQDEQIIYYCTLLSRGQKRFSLYPKNQNSAKHDKLVFLVDNLLELQKKHHDAKMEQDKELYERQIKLVDAQIDGRVYDLYGLTDEEIEIVEKSL